MANDPSFVGPKIKSALVGLSRSVDNYFQSVGVNASVYLGLKRRDSWDASRVVIIEGDFDGSDKPGPLKGGQLEAPTQKQSYNPRELLSWVRQLTISVWGVDTSQLDSEAAQLEACESLMEATVQAIHNAMAADGKTALGQASLLWGDITVIYPPVQQSFGREYLIHLTQRTVIFDLANQVSFPVQNQSHQVLTSGTSGVNAFISQVQGTVVAVTGLAFCSANYVGRSLALSGCATPANNGTFPITGLVNGQGLLITNASGVAPDANSGFITWSIVPSP